MEIQYLEKCNMFPKELKLFLQNFINIKSQIIDFNNFEVKIVDKYEMVTIKAHNNICCPISFIVWNNKGKIKFQFCYGANGAVLEDELESFQSGVQSYKEYLIKYLSTSVEEHLTYCKGRLVKGKYFYYYIFGKRKKKTTYIGYQQFIIWPWEPKVKEIHNYEPWLQEQDILSLSQSLSIK